MAKRQDQYDFEIEIEKLRLGADRFNGWMELARLVIVAGGVLYALHMIMAGLGRVLAHSAAVISASSSLLTSSPPLAFSHRLRGKGGDSYGAQAACA